MQSVGFVIGLCRWVVREGLGNRWVAGHNSSLVKRSCQKVLSKGLVKRSRQWSSQKVTSEGNNIHHVRGSGQKVTSMVKSEGNNIGHVRGSSQKVTTVLPSKGQVKGSSRRVKSEHQIRNTKKINL